VLADRLRGAVAEDALGAEVPGADDAVERLADDRVVGGGDDGGEPRLALACFDRGTCSVLLDLHEASPPKRRNRKF
jgi:hypothetical protein